MNLGWTPEWAACQVHCLDIWTDEKSCAVATEEQRQIHLRRMRHYWVPGWIDKVEYEPDGTGLLTVTYFAGMDKQVYEEINCRAAFRSLKRTDDCLRIIGGGSGDNGSGVHVRKWHDVDPSPPPGSSGITHEIHVSKVGIQEDSARAGSCGRAAIPGRGRSSRRNGGCPFRSQWTSRGSSTDARVAAFDYPRHQHRSRSQICRQYKKLGRLL